MASPEGAGRPIPQRYLAKEGSGGGTQRKEGINAANAIAEMIVKGKLEEGKPIEIPSLGIKLVGGKWIKSEPQPPQK